MIERLLASLAPGPLRADLDDVIKGLLILLFFAGPAIKALLEKVAKARPSAPRPSPGPARPVARRAVTWEDLMRGAVPKAPEPQREADDAGDRGASGEARVEPSVELPVAPQPALAADLTPQVFAEIPTEELLEQGGGEEEYLKRALDSSWAASSARPLPQAGVPSPGPVPSSPEGGGRVRPALRAEGKPALRAAGMPAHAWRRAVLLAEVLGRPLALREDWSHPGPPAARR